MSGRSDGTTTFGSAVNTNLPPNFPVTFMMWIKLIALVANTVPISLFDFGFFRQVWQIGFDAAGSLPSLSSRFGSATAPAADALVAGRWYHIAGTIDVNNNGVLYINGLPVASAALGNPATTATNFRLGMSPSDTGINGYSSAVKIWRRALSQDEVLLESKSYMPVNWGGLYDAWPLLLGAANSPGSSGTPVNELGFYRHRLFGAGGGPATQLAPDGNNPPIQMYAQPFRKRFQRLPHPLSNTGTAILDFGNAPVKNTMASVVITEQEQILAGSQVEAFFMKNSVPDPNGHSSDEELIENIRLQCDDVVAGQGFTIYGECTIGTTNGKFKVQYVWV